MAVRRESVLLEVEGNFQRQILEDAAAVDVLKRSLKDLSGTSVQTSRSQDGLGRSVDGAEKSTRRAAKTTKEYGLAQAILDERTRRTNQALRDQAKAAVDAEQGIKRAKKEARGGNLLWSSIGAGFPVVSPLGAVGAAGLGGIANDAGMAVTALASLTVALHGVMPALEAVNKAGLNPTAANLRAASDAMHQLSPDARAFVVELQSMEPLLHKIQAAAASGWFPGLTSALENLRPLTPVISRIFHDVGTMGGNLLASGAKALAGPEWRDFFKFIDTEAPKAMAAMGHVIGSLAHGLAQLWMAFTPLNNGFNNWLVDVAKGFDSWATGLSQTQGFHDFIAYIDQNGPKVAAAVDAIANAVLQIAKAAAPLGGPTLDAITAIANALSLIAKSPLGTPILLLLQMASVARLANTAVGGLVKAYKNLFVAETEAGVAGGRVPKGGISAAIALLGGTAANAGFDAVGNTLSPGQNDLGTPGNISAIVDSIHKSTGFKGVLGGYLADPAKLVGFNPDHIGDKGPYQQADASLAELVASGNGQKAAEIFAKINSQVADAPKYFPAYEASLKGVGNASGSAARKTAALRAANKQTADSFVNLATDMKKPTLSLDNLITRWRQQAAAEAELGKNIAAAVAKGANPEALSKIIDQLGPQAGLAIKQLAHGGKSDIADLNAAFHTGQRAANTYNTSLDNLRSSLLGIPPHVQSVVNVVSHDQPLRNTIGELERLHDKTVNVWVRTFTPGKSPSMHGFHQDPTTGQAVPNANGGTVPKTGKPYADRHLYLLADGEEVISNRFGQADRHRALLKAINANRMASGGTAGRWSGAGGSSMVRHVIEVKVIGGELDLNKARHQIHAIAREVSRDEIDQNASWEAR